MTEQWADFGVRRCERCGKDVAVGQFLGGTHTCAADSGDDLLASVRLREQVRILCLEIEEFLVSDRAIRQAQFARWCREHGR